MVDSNVRYRKMLDPPPQSYVCMSQVGSEPQMCPMPPKTSLMGGRVRHQLLIIEKGSVSRQDLFSIDIFKMVYAYSRSENANGSETEDLAKRPKDEQRHRSLKYRDIRQLVSDLSTNQPIIEARRQCIIVNLPPVRCIIMATRIFLLSPVSDPLSVQADEVIPAEVSQVVKKKLFDLESHLTDSLIPNVVKLTSGYGFNGAKKVTSNASGDDWRARHTDVHFEPGAEFSRVRRLITSLMDTASVTVAPMSFELRALQCIFIEVCQTLTKLLDPLRVLCEKSAMSLRRDAQGYKLPEEEMHWTKSKLRALNNRATALRKPFESLLASEVALRRLDLSTTVQKVWRGVSKVKAARRFIHTEAHKGDKDHSVEFQMTHNHDNHHHHHDHDDQPNEEDIDHEHEGGESSNNETVNPSKRLSAPMTLSVPNRGAARLSTSISTPSIQAMQNRASIAVDKHQLLSPHQGKPGGDGDGGECKSTSGEAAPYSVDDAEMLLECYLQEIEHVIHAAESLDESLDDVLQLTNLQLASARIRLMKVDLGVTIMSCIIGLASCVASVFGMNLPSSYFDPQRESESAFTFVMMLCFGIVVLGFAFTMAYLRRLRRL